MINVITKYESILVEEESGETANDNCAKVEPSPTLSQVKVAQDLTSSEYRIMVHNVSMPFYDKNLSTTFCLVYVSYSDCKLLIYFSVGLSIFINLENAFVKFMEGHNQELCFFSLIAPHTKIKKYIVRIFLLGFDTFYFTEPYMYSQISY